MASKHYELLEVDLGDSMAGKARRRPRWTPGRIATDLAIVAVSVPIGLDILVPPARGGCGMTPQFCAWTLGSTFLYARMNWFLIAAIRRRFPIFDDFARAIDRRHSKPSKPLSLPDPWTP